MKRNHRMTKFIRDLAMRTALLKIVLLLVVLWLLFSSAMFLAERLAGGASTLSFSESLYWGIAALSTAGIADAPTAGFSQLIGGIWSVLGSMLFFGTIVATITAYFLRPLQRPSRQIVETIEYNLEQLDDLTIEELELLKDTIDALIVHVESSKQANDETTGSA